MKLILMLSIIIGLVLGYGYWHSITHGSVYIDLKYETPEDRDNLSSKIGVFFLDVDGKVLGQGISDKNYNYIELIHPEVGNCHDLVRKISNKETRSLWQKCFKKQSTWIMKWIKEVNQVVVNHEKCSSNKVHIILNEYNSDWLLWWVPHPHIGGKPYLYFRASIDLKKHDCFK